ncbi:MAG: hypothetical protein IPJ69_03700 [Deltaproteobacteria bacterium]|nr:MAG: hypothetical protein IPJ69_03700 [Deltaproteobacteria bacterium]
MNEDIFTHSIEPDSENLLTTPSPRLSRRVWIAGGGVGILLLTLFLWPHHEERSTSRDQGELTRVIPDEEIKPSLLSSLTKEDEKPKKAEPSSRPSTSVAPVAPSGSMAIFISDNSQSGGSSLGIPLGAEIEATIEQTVNANSHGIPIIAKMTGDFIRDQKIVAPRGSRLFGETSGMVDSQLGIHFSKIVFPNGEDHPFSGMTTVEGHLNRKGGNRGLSILSGAALGSTSIFAPQGAGFGDTFLRSAQQGGMNEASRDWNYYKAMEAMPSIKISANKKIHILVDRPL